MNSYLFHDGDELVAPVPDEYAIFTQERAVWQALGLRAEEMTETEFAKATYFLSIESEQREKRKTGGES